MEKQDIIITIESDDFKEVYKLLGRLNNEGLMVKTVSFKKKNKENKVEIKGEKSKMDELIANLSQNI
jgi:hypothetical protein